MPFCPSPGPRPGIFPPPGKARPCTIVRTTPKRPSRPLPHRRPSALHPGPGGEDPVKTRLSALFNRFCGKRCGKAVGKRPAIPVHRAISAFCTEHCAGIGALCFQSLAHHPPARSRGIGAVSAREFSTSGTGRKSGVDTARALPAFIRSSPRRRDGACHAALLRGRTSPGECRCKPSGRYFRRASGDRSARTIARVPAHHWKPTPGPSRCSRRGARPSADRAEKPVEKTPFQRRESTNDGQGQRFAQRSVQPSTSRLFSVIYRNSNISLRGAAGGCGREFSTGLPSC